MTMFDDIRSEPGDDVALAAISGLPDLVCLCQDNIVQWINAAGLRLLNADDEKQVIGMQFTDFLGADYAALGSELYELLTEEQAPVQTKMKALNGDSYDCEISILAHFANTSDRYVVYARNISEFTRIAENLHLREDYLRDLINNSLNLICECRNGTVRFINQAGVKLLGMDADTDVIGMPIQDLFHRDYHDIFLKEFQDVLNEDTFIPLRLKRANESYVDVEVAFTPMGHSRHNSFLAEAHDITQHNRAVSDLREFIDNLEIRVEERTESLQKEIATRRQAEKQLRHLATHDALTGLPNRTLLRDRLESEIAGVERHKNKIAVIFIDLDGFKTVNDTLGHDAGDELLIWVSGVLNESVRAIDTVARNGGDEFVVLLTDIESKDGAVFVAWKIIERISENIKIAGAPVSIGASLGIALCPDDSGDVDSLMHQADAAMYEVKKSGKNNFQFFSDMTAIPE